MSIFEMINNALGPICTFLIMCFFICGVVIPMFRVLLGHLKGEEARDDDEAVLQFEILFNHELPNIQLPEIIDNTKGIDVHDHTVQESLVKSFSKLSEKISHSNDSTEEIKKAIFEYGKTDVEMAERAYSTLRTIMKYNGKLSSINTDELTVLNMVWARIMDPVNEKVKQDLIDNLIRQLSEASLTLDQSRCLSGRIARIIQSLEAIDSENIVNIASSEDIRRELSDKVPVLIAGYTEDLDNTEKLKQFVDMELRKDYVETKLLTEAEYLRIVKDYLEAIE